MHWVAPSGKNADNAALEKRPWERRTRDLLLPRLLSGKVNLPTN
jgi:hypothetical protein